MKRIVNVNDSPVYTTSDERLKENIDSADFSKAFNAHDIDIKEFNFKDDETKAKMYGVIAQNLLNHDLKELVYEDENGTYSVDYTSLLLLKVKFLENEVELLKYRLEKLENKDK